MNVYMPIKFSKLDCVMTVMYTVVRSLYISLNAKNLTLKLDIVIHRPFLFHIKIWAYQYWACPLLILAGQMSFHQNMQILSMYRENAEVANTEIHLYTDGTKLNVLQYYGYMV